ncbi:S9 family peptidase [Caulobacter endophyticus]|uniref:S9 family peptidase n=1 Tax=Caulobacter endophyticus TaxID=2172652 RepID=A0A2T9K435_9CAUL|nr:prolyl oligopeptidase family serine peptidase [Caulobacter endophyticus]PVM90739.1 S9 family peptidase [Caulobacter endophyticus]
MFNTQFRRRAAALASTAVLAVLIGGSVALAGEAYRMPPAPIAQILDAAPTPGVTLSPERKTLALLGRENLPPIRAVADPILRLGGYRINPRTNGPVEARTAWMNSLAFEDVKTGVVRQVALPPGARFIQPRWSGDGQQLALVMEAPTGLELWVADLKTAKVRKLTGPVLNAAFGAAYDWLPDDSGLLVRQIPAGRGAAPAEPAAPEGPIVQQSAGRTAAIRTYQDLLGDAHDEALFDHYFTSQMTRVALADGAAVPVGAPGVINGFGLSPDGRYLLVTRLKRPYSYLVPAARFPTEIQILDAADGRLVKTLVDRPLADNLSSAFDAVVAGPRNPQWRGDAPSTLVWVEAQDGGDPKKKVEIHDRVLMQAAPFEAAPTTLVDLDLRYAGIDWGREDFALVHSRWFDNRKEKQFVVDPSKPGAGRVLVERNYQDRYNDPGSAMSRRNAQGEEVLHFTPDGKGVFVSGEGATAKGEFPFVGVMNLADGKTTRLWQAKAPYYEAPVTFADEAGKTLITRRESKDEVPNYFVKPLKGGNGRALTSFVDRAPQFAGVTKQTITYSRADGVKLSGDLYLPAGYDKAKDGPLPMLMWAYPEEFTDASVAGQTVDAGNRFTRPGGASHLFLLTQGYAVLDGPGMPIIGKDGAEPNDSYVEQLVSDAKAAVDAVVALGVADRDRIAVGGHSYGAFMTANLLAHSDLFRAGIARSGAYNRTLTPFGFQSEQRTYWQATDTYTKMSPFTYVKQVNEPILLIHGEADDNSGTFPIQSERFYAALKGAGATVRYTVLPYEAHGYRARESVMHTLWEMTDWMDRYVKNAPPRAAAAAPVAPATK